MARTGATVFLILTLSFTSCVTGEKMSGVQPGMTKSEVIAVLGGPDGFRAAGDYEASSTQTA